jgi:hypothetical protein
MEFLSSSSQHHSFRSGFAAFPSISVFIRPRPYGPTRVLASRDHETSCQVRGNPDATRQQCGSNAPANETGFYKLRGCRATMIPPHTSRNLLQWTLAIGHAIAVCCPDEHERHAGLHDTPLFSSPEYVLRSHHHQLRADSMHQGPYPANPVLLSTFHPQATARLVLSKQFKLSSFTDVL